MKNRHIKTIRERFGFNQNIPDEPTLRKHQFETIQKINEYRTHNLKKNHEYAFDLVQCMIDLCINYKGIFYLKALGEYNENDEYKKGIFKEDGKWSGYYDYCDAYFFQYDDTRPKRVTLKSPYKNGDKEYMEYTKYYVIEVSKNGWYYVLFQNWFGDLDYVIHKDNILLEGNIATLMD